MCDYTTGDRYNYIRHVSTRKHQNYPQFLNASFLSASEKNATTDSSVSNELCFDNFNDFFCKKVTNEASHFSSQTRQYMEHKPTPSTKTYSCQQCNRTYNNRHSLYYHIKRCNKTTPVVVPDSVEWKNAVHEMKDYIKDVIRDIVQSGDNGTIIHQTNYNHIQNNIMNNHNTTTNNNHFNLMLFLTEKCKHAMNLSEFVDTLQVTFQEVEDMGKLGYVQGLSNIIVNALNQLDITQRPIHCTDLKRETLYVKENDEWHRDDAKDKLKKIALKGATCKNIVRFKEWVLVEPNRSKPDTKEYNMHIQIMGQCINTGDIDNRNEGRIISNIAKTVYLDKETKDRWGVV